MTWEIRLKDEQLDMRRLQIIILFWGFWSVEQNDFVLGYG
jgi:hypothetical protein